MKTLHKIPFGGFLLLAFCMIFFTGCIEIVEEITLNKDKSGTIAYRIEFSEEGSFLSGLSNLFNTAVEDQLRIESNKLIGQLLKQPGISNIRYDLNGRSGSYFLQFDFSDYRSFNNALYAVGGNKKTIFTPGYFKLGNHKFKKINFSPWIKKYMERENIELPNSMITEMISFRSILHSPMDIKRASPGKSVTLRSKRETSQLFKLPEIIDNKVNTSLKVRY